MRRTRKLPLCSGGHFARSGQRHPRSRRVDLLRHTSISARRNPGDDSPPTEKRRRRLAYVAFLLPLSRDPRAQAGRTSQRLGRTRCESSCACCFRHLLSVRWAAGFLGNYSRPTLHGSDTTEEICRRWDNSSDPRLNPRRATSMGRIQKAILFGFSSTNCAVSKASVR